MIHYNIEADIPNEISLKNSNRFIIEGWIFGSSRLKKLFISIGDKNFQAKETELYRPDVSAIHHSNDSNFCSIFSGFSIPITLEPILEFKEYDVFLNAKFKNGETIRNKIKTVKIFPWAPKNFNYSLPEGINAEELLVICMATYNPEKMVFQRQIDSIIKQDFENWICIISDDCSDAHVRKDMKEILKKDPRFSFVENKENVGFYKNFERALEMVPSYAKYVSLSDQDDFWYPNKLSETIKKLNGTTQLVYCDMRIVCENSEIISETYWDKRKNYYKTKNLDLLVIANTVTGAASVFRASLLDKILPFPPRYGNVFHDNWIAIIAASNGGIDYIDKPLYDYMQSGNNVIGHTNFEQKNLKDYVFSFIDNSKKVFRQNTRTRLKGLLKYYIENFIFNFKIIYNFKHINAKHIFTIIEAALVRQPNNKYNYLLRRALSISGLLKIHYKVRRNKETLNNLELYLLFSYIVNKIVNSLAIPLRKPIRKLLNKVNKPKNIVPSSSECTADPNIIEFKRKFLSRKFIVTEKKQHVNVLMSQLDPKNFFGGYMGMYNFAKRFYELGFSVRMLLTDQKKIIQDDLEKIQNHDLNLKSFLLKADFLPCFSSEQSISISERDIFVATSWWTAHIASEAVSKTKFKKFIYLAQDYEPVFYEHGAYRILADRSYNLDFFPVFSTDVLQKFFVKTGKLKQVDAGVYFKNPVLKFDTDSNLKRNRKGKKKLLFYARPQPNNARNLYPIGCLAIDRAYELGGFKDNEWEIIGIGGDCGEQELPCGIKIKHIGKFNMKEYKDILPEYDLGLALMDSPHPSLLPIEMASAGLLVVTNTYSDIKNHEYFENISTNIRAIEPDIDLLAQALIKCSNKVDDIESRIKGSKIKWPHNWEDTLTTDKIEKAINAVYNSECEF